MIAVPGRSTVAAGLMAPLVAAAAFTVLAAAPAAADTCTGVAVVVDFGALPGGVRSGCAPGDPGSGLQALSTAGFGYSFVPRQPGLVCQINSRPNPCNGAPSTAYWSYWHARPGGSWTYSNTGAGGHNPAPGSVEGWAFGSGQPPGMAPPPAAARPAPQPPPGPPPPAAGQPAPGSPPASRPGTARASSSASGVVPGPPTPAPGVSTPAVTTITAATAQDAPVTSASGQPAGAAPGGDPAFPVWPVTGTALVAALGGLAWWTARRRARLDAQDGMLDG